MGQKLAFVAVFILGGLLGYFTPRMATNDGNASGDITKVSKFHKKVASNATSAYVENLLNNEEEMQKTAASLTFLSSRMMEFDELVKASVAIVEEKGEFASLMESLKNVQLMAANARENGENALCALESLLKGEAADVDIEQASQNLSVAYLMVGRQIGLGKDFVNELDKYLERDGIEDNMDIAFVRDLWANYCACDAALSGNKEELAYWSKKGWTLSEAQLANELSTLNFILYNTQNESLKNQEVPTYEASLKAAIGCAIANQVMTPSFTQNIFVTALMDHSKVSEVNVDLENHLLQETIPIIMNTEVVKDLVIKGFETLQPALQAN